MLTSVLRNPLWVATGVNALTNRTAVLKCADNGLLVHSPQLEGKQLRESRWLPFPLASWKKLDIKEGVI